MQFGSAWLRRVLNAVSAVSLPPIPSALAVSTNGKGSVD